MKVKNTGGDVLIESVNPPYRLTFLAGEVKDVLKEIGEDLLKNPIFIEVKKER